MPYIQICFHHLIWGSPRLKIVCSWAPCTGLEEADNGFPRLAEYFAERARGGVGMMITGGISPNMEGGFGAKLSTPEEAEDHRLVTTAVHAVDPDIKICMQILHAGPLAGTPACVAPSAIPRESRAWCPTN